MANPIDDLHEFDLHIYVGTRSWPDDIEKYCYVTYPGLDGEHSIRVDYMIFAANYSLERAIQLALADIGVYMDDPELWVEEYIKKSGTAWEKRRELEVELEETRSSLNAYQQSVSSYQERIDSIEKRLQELPETTS